ncbi:hypothetical protein PS726_02472 [Pseudomonas fluorescens]|uniref:hypothetical protein n=1 Tax=Pseudomonas fluorescens TaxID=294 RepID=UPI0012402344|nr:hypothetical protein [Pseudomonas fluorescens]VVN98763.1 hypothetical protein PS726_02472 [Pseudomonas fluorescens]
MSLLSGLLDSLPPPVADAGRPTMANLTTDDPLPVMVERPTQFQTSLYTNAANATHEWRQARDQYIKHVMACRACHAPTGRYCAVGAVLLETYNQTPMELPV